MKNIYVSYDTLGYIENMSDNALHFEQENKSLKVEASIATDKRVRAYIRAANNNSLVTEELAATDNVYSFTVDSDYMAKGTMYVGFELYDDTGYIERLEPLKIYIDSFINLGDGSNDNVYVVTVTAGNVETVEPGQPAQVINSGNKKDMVLDFKIPQGIQGLKGDKGERGEQGIPGNDGYTPIKGVDYFTEDDIKSLGIENKVDKEKGKGLSTNDFTDDLRKRLEENTFSGYIEAEVEDEMFGHMTFDFDSYTTRGVYLLYNDVPMSDDCEREYYILTVTYLYSHQDSTTEYTVVQVLFNLVTGELTSRFAGILSQNWSAWKRVSVSQTDLNSYVTKATFNSNIGDIETALAENKTEIASNESKIATIETAIEGVQDFVLRVQDGILSQQNEILGGNE